MHILVVKSLRLLHLFLTESHAYIHKLPHNRTSIFQQTRRTTMSPDRLARSNHGATKPTTSLQRRHLPNIPITMGLSCQDMFAVQKKIQMLLHPWGVLPKASMILVRTTRAPLPQSRTRNLWYQESRDTTVAIKAWRTVVTAAWIRGLQ